MRFVLLLMTIGSLTWALDTSNMFFTPEPYNMYNETFEDEKSKKEKTKAKEDALALPEKEKEPQTLKEKLKYGDLFFNAYMGFTTYPSYNKPGNSLTVTAEKMLPKLWEGYEGLLAEIDYSFATRAVKDGLDILPDLKINSGAVYAGYLFQINEKTQIKAKGGAAYVSDPVGSMQFAGGIGIYRKFTIKSFDVAGDLVVKGPVWYINIGIHYKFQRR